VYEDVMFMAEQRVREARWKAHEAREARRSRRHRRILRGRIRREG
jgi:hypothetical protein